MFRSFTAAILYVALAMSTCNSLRSANANATPQVDFAYAFSTPHRITVAPPDSGDKTLVDCEPGKITLSWSYDTLLTFPVANFFGPQTQWRLVLRPAIDGQKLEQSTWRRLDGWLPALHSEFTHPTVDTAFEVIGSPRAAIVRVEFHNRDRVEHLASVDCGVAKPWPGVSPAFVDPGLPQNARDALVAGWMARADRVLIAGLGGENYSTAANAFTPSLHLAPGETKTLWFVRPYRVYESMLPELRRRDWAQEFADAKVTWQKLIGRTARLGAEGDFR